MNHGYCKNCWWYKSTVLQHYYFDGSGQLTKHPGGGRCYKHHAGNEDEYGNDYKIVASDCYCPDYCNRKKEEKTSGTLEDWISAEKNRQL